MNPLPPTRVAGTPIAASAADARLRALTAGPIVSVSLPDVLVLLRVGAVLLVVAVALGVQTWARTEVRARALQLDDTRSDLARAEILHNRLVLERAMQLQPARLHAQAEALGLVAPVSVQTIADTP